MRLGQFQTAESDAWAGVPIADEQVVHLQEAGVEAGVGVPRRTSEVLAQWHWREKAELAVEYARETGVGLYDRSDLERRAPITDPGKIVAVGLNYADHAEESGGEAPDDPVLFAKFTTAVVGPDAPIEWDPALTDEVDYEAEMVAVIGREAREVSVEAAPDHVAGYTVGNDVSARDVQLGDEQWVRGKSLDTFAPIGPDIVTPDEVGDPHDRAIYADLNGDRLQDASTAQLIFDTHELVAFCSRAFTLEPGDLIFTGTPEGVGAFRDPPILMEEGDTITVGVEGIGELTNHCRYR